MNLDLALRFGVSETSVTTVSRTMVSAVHQILGALHSGEMPSVRKNETLTPECFSKLQGNRVILDCTEIERDVQRRDMTEQRQSFSHYKQRHTYEALVGVAPNGAITFMSDLFMGLASDNEITMRSSIMSQLKPSDLV